MLFPSIYTPVAYDRHLDLRRVEVPEITIDTPSDVDSDWIFAGDRASIAVTAHLVVTGPGHFNFAIGTCSDPTIPLTKIAQHVLTGAGTWTHYLYAGGLDTYVRIISSVIGAGTTASVRYEVILR